MTSNPQRSAFIFGSWCHSPTPSVFLYCLIIHYSLFSQIMLKLTYSNWFTCHPLNIPCTFLPATFYSHCSSHLENPLLSNQVHPSFICSSHPNSSVSFLIHPGLGWALLYFVAFIVAGVMNGWSADVFCLASQRLERKKKTKRNLNVFGWGKCSPVCQIPTLLMFLHPVFWFTSGLIYIRALGLANSACTANWTITWSFAPFLLLPPYLSFQHHNFQGAGLQRFLWHFRFVSLPLSSLSSAKWFQNKIFPAPGELLPKETPCSFVMLILNP